MEETTEVGDGDGQIPEEQFQEIKRERWRERDSLTKKHRDVQFAVAQALNAACHNPPATALFRGDQMESIRKSFQPWCNLSESFAPGGKSLEDHQMEVRKGENLIWTRGAEV